MNPWIQLTSLWALAALMMSLGWFWQRSRGNAGIVDVLWAAGTGLSAGGNFVLTNNSITVGSNTYGLSLSNSNNLEVLNVGVAPPTIAYWAGNINNVWSTNNSGSTNWRTDATTNTDTQLPPGSTTNVFFSTQGL